jgi:hypothetical protein
LVKLKASGPLKKTIHGEGRFAPQNFLLRTRRADARVYRGGRRSRLQTPEILAHGLSMADLFFLSGTRS